MESLEPRYIPTHFFFYHLRWNFSLFFAFEFLFLAKKKIFFESYKKERKEGQEG